MVLFVPVPALKESVLGFLQEGHNHVSFFLLNDNKDEGISFMLLMANGLEGGCVWLLIVFVEEVLMMITRKESGGKKMEVVRLWYVYLITKRHEEYVGYLMPIYACTSHIQTLNLECVLLIAKYLM